MRPGWSSLGVVPPLQPVGLLASGLIVVENSVLDDEEVFGLHAFVIVAYGGASAFLRPVTLDVHELGTVTQLTQHFLGGRDEARSGIVGFVTQRTVELGRVGDRFVHGEPEVRRMEDEIVAT